MFSEIVLELLRRWHVYSLMHSTIEQPSRTTDKHRFTFNGRWYHALFSVVSRIANE
jgi:hypothetical protein